ncbi:MAG TPA: class I SAM-dependent methyltransferase [Bryobacteraceae bacterium]|nr:class I SAM-dependent methyltransferase [Bryobacteraceae bacterium]
MTGLPDYDRSQWQAEAEFFDRKAAEQQVAPLDPRIVQRYAHPAGPWHIDFCFRMAGDLRGKTVLDVGAGLGENSLVLAALGAKVTALDISSGSLEVLTRRAQLSGLADRITTVCSPLEAWDSKETFDLVWIDSFLHHVIPNLPFVLGKIRDRLNPGGRLIVAEPFSPRLLRTLRMALPISTNGTPGERPLNSTEINIIRRCFQGAHTRYFLFLSRFQRFFPFASSLAGLDAALLRAPGIRKLGGYIVIWT